MTCSLRFRNSYAYQCRFALVVFAAAVAVLASVPGSGAAAQETSANSKSSDQKQKVEDLRKPIPRITVSIETTRVLKPLDEDGYVDYAAAINQVTSEGITPQSNAGVFFVRAFGPGKHLEKPERVRVFELLKIEPLGETDSYFVDFSEFVKFKFGRIPADADWDSLEKAMTEPWSARQFPLLAEWLQGNEKPLQLVVDGTRCPRCYIPLIVPGNWTLIAADLSVAQAARSGAQALAARAMQKLGEGKIAGAQSDLLACHRLGRLIGSTPFLIGLLIGKAIDHLACDGDAALIEHAHLTVEQAFAYQQELRNLAPFRPVAEEIDVFERYMFLDAVGMLARKKSSFQQIVFADPEIKSTGLLRGIEELLTDPLLVNWDEALRLGNETFDKLVAAAKRSTIHDRKKAFEKIERERAEFRSEILEPGKFAASLLHGPTPRKAMGRNVGKILVLLLTPALDAACEAENRAHTREVLGQLGFTLVAYRADHGAYPDKLETLVPKYIAAVPKDLYTEQALHYARLGEGFLLYSVGQNEQDDGGRTFDSQPEGDDIVLRIPQTHGK